MNSEAPKAFKAISPIDGRYRNTTEKLSGYFSEYGLVQYRLRVEVEYFIALCEIPLPELKDVSKESFEEVRDIYKNFNDEGFATIKEIEKVTNHDVKAVEYFLKEKFDEIGLGKYKEFIHFGLTSQDINNTAIPMTLRDSMDDVIYKVFDEILLSLKNRADEWKDIPMLARTHGQPATPTRLGKEFQVFLARLEVQIGQLKNIPYSAKFGGATGNMNAHKVTYPDIDWQNFADNFVNKTLKLDRSNPTTQIEHYDNLAAFCDAIKRINTILIDLDRDMWSYISMDYFKQKIKVGEVGSSAMPHKVNPIDFENSEGNLGLANANFEHLSAKLPISRLQRDLTDSTVLRNIGVPIAHSLIAYKSLLRGLNKLVLNKEKIDKDLNDNWIVVAEAIQSILRRVGYEKPYEALKDLTRGNSLITQKVMEDFIDTLNVDNKTKLELKAITPFNYTGY